MTRALFISLAMVTAGTGHACPDGSETLVSCTSGGGTKYLETCLLGDHATYSFGETGKWPDLALARHVRDVDMTPWPGIGRSIWEDLTFTNGDVSYRVFYSFEKAIETVPGLSAGVEVERDGEVIASVICDPDSIDFSGYSMPLYEAKEAAGQVFSLEDRRWE